MSTVNGNYYGGIVKNGLVLLLDAAKRDSYPRVGTTWTDISWNGNNGILSVPTFNSNNGGDFVFDGLDDFVNCGNNSSLSFTNSLTIEVWCSSNVSDVNYRCPLFKTSNSSWTDGYGFYQQGGFFNFYVNVWNGTHRVRISKTTFSLTHFVGTYDGSNLKIYENGVLGQTGLPYSLNVSNPITNLTVGRGGVANYYWNGSIPRVSIYNKALTSSEVLQNYNALKGRFGL